MEKDKKPLSLYVERWKRTGAILENMRQNDIRDSNLEDSLAAFEEVFLVSLNLSPNKMTSGLVEFHKILAKTLCKP